jgi:hypothetical protein
LVYHPDTPDDVNGPASGDHHSHDAAGAINDRVPTRRSARKLALLRQQGAIVPML